jgi:hypothetical protein
MKGIWLCFLDINLLYLTTGARVPGTHVPELAVCPPTDLPTETETEVMVMVPEYLSLSSSAIRYTSVILR